MFLRRYVQETVPSTFCFTTHFMEWMLAEEDDSVVYDYEKVKHWSDGIAGGLFGQKNLFVPVNISNTHWIFLRVDFDSKTIELYDSMGGPNPSNRKYLLALRYYLYDEECKTVAPERCPDFEQWKADWRIRDMSRHSPRQRNGNDCGVFTLLSIYLLSRGVRLTKNSYSQLCVTTRKLRRSIAFALLQANELAPVAPTGSAGLARPRAPLPREVARKRKARTTAARAGKRRRREEEATAGKAKVTTSEARRHRQDGTPLDALTNRKRQAKSLADNPSTQMTIEKFLHQSRKKARKRSTRRIICYL